MKVKIFQTGPSFGPDSLEKEINEWLGDKKTNNIRAILPIQSESKEGITISIFYSEEV